MNQNKKYLIRKRNGSWRVLPPYPVMPIVAPSFEAAIRITDYAVMSLYNPKAS